MNSILVLEDIKDVRSWLVGVLGDIFPGTAISETGTLAHARSVTSSHPFDLALIDISVPDGNGIDLIPLLRRLNPTIRCVISTIFEDDANIMRALRAGADGYLLKDQTEERLREGLVRTMHGEPSLAPRVASRILNHFRKVSLPEASATSAAKLTNREREILTLVAKGLNRADVAVALDIGTRTVASHIGAIYRKLDVSSRAEATIEAIRMGLVHA